jgi:peptide deformylase
VSVLGIHVLGSPILRQETEPVAAVTDEIRRLIDDMFETMYLAHGIGLAAPQVGRRERVTVVDAERDRTQPRPLVLVNPMIVSRDGSVRGEEGCLSIPEIYGDVDRAATVIVRALDRDGQPFEIEGTELLGRCLQHEIDHLHGRLFIDYLSLFKRRAALAKWEEEKVKYPTLVRTVTPSPPPPVGSLAEAHEEEEL